MREATWAASVLLALAVGLAFGAWVTIELAGIGAAVSGG